MNTPDRARSGRHVRTRPNGILVRTGVALALCLPTLPPAALATERDLGAHEHGAATLDVALDGTRLYVDLTGPADNVLGFEHAPSTDAQRAVVAEAERLLGSPELFVPSAAAGCALEEATVDIALPESGHESDDDEHGHDDADADGDAAHEEDHDDEHEEEHDDGHDDEHEEEHDGHDGEHEEDHEATHSGEHDEEGETHSEMTAGYVFTCEDPAALGELATTLFERFDGFVDVDVQLVGPGGQDGARLTADDTTVSLETIR